MQALNAQDFRDREQVKKAMEIVFQALCGDYLGAVTVRNSHKAFAELGRLDEKEETENTGDVGILVDQSLEHTTFPLL